MIPFTCPSCRETFEVPDCLLGQFEKCPNCSEVVKLPREPTGPITVLRDKPVREAPPRRAHTPVATRTPDEPRHAPTRKEHDGVDWEAPIRHFFTEIAGVTHDNADGTRREDVIRDCERLEQLDVEPDPDNQHDPNAIRVCRKNGEQLGYLNRFLARHVAEEIEEGWGYTAFFAGFAGRDGDDEEEFADEDCSLGYVKIVLLGVSPESTDNEGQQYLDSVMDEIVRRASGYNVGR